MVAGEYYKALGITVLEDDYEDVKTTDVNKNAAFLHERIHFIQNFSTLYGITNATYYLSQYLGMILKVRDGEFPISPFLPYDNEEQEFINALFTCSAGDSFDSNGKCIQCHSIQNIKMENNYSEYYSEQFPTWKNRFKEQVVLIFDDEKRYEFGAIAIEESMAYLFERYVYTVNDYSHRFPYNACELIFHYIMGEECEHDNVLIALCYVSLMTLWPGNTFIELLNELKNEKLKYTSMKEVFEFAKKKILPINATIIDEVCKKVDLVFPIAKENWIRVYEENSQYTCNWLQERYRYLAENEQEFRRAMIWVMEECESEKRVEKLSRLLNEYGHPIVIDKNGKLYSDNDKKIVHMLAPYSLWGILMEKNGMCKLYSVCKGNNKNPDNECRTMCWKHTDSHHICIMKYYLETMGLKNVEFDKLKNSPFRERGKE